MAARKPKIEYYWTWRMLRGEEEEDHPLDAAEAKAPQKSVEMRRMSPEVLAEALAVIEAIPEAERTIETVFGALWATWVD